MIGGEFGPVVGAEDGRFAAGGDDAVEDIGDRLGSQRVADLEGQGLAAEGVDHG